MTKPPRKTHIGHYDECRYWKVIKDPSGLFTGNLFRLVDLEAGGFDPGTTFEHILNGKQRVAGADGTTRKRESDGKLSSSRPRTGSTLLQAKVAQSRVRTTRNPHRRVSA